MTTVIERTSFAAVPKPGIYPDVSLREYIAWDAVSSTILKAMRKSPAHAKYAKENATWSDALELGDATHLRILQPEKFHERYRLGGQCEASTLKGGRCKHGATIAVGSLQYCSTHGDMLDDPSAPVLLTQTKWDRVNGMREMVRNDSDAAILLGEEGPVELSIVWTDKSTGLLCKARLDKVSIATKSITDLKTTQDAEPEAFSRSIGNYGYELQGAHYLCGAQANGLDVQQFGFVAVESDAPYCPACYELEPAAIALGFKQQQKLLTQYVKCWQNNHWPGYSQGITRIGVTQFATQQIERRMSA